MTSLIDSSESKTSKGPKPMVSFKIASMSCSRSVRVIKLGASSETNWAMAPKTCSRITLSSVVLPSWANQSLQLGADGSAFSVLHEDLQELKTAFAWLACSRFLG